MPHLATDFRRPFQGGGLAEGPQPVRREPGFKPRAVRTGKQKAQTQKRLPQLGSLKLWGGVLRRGTLPQNSPD